LAILRGGHVAQNALLPLINTVALRGRGQLTWLLTDELTGQEERKQTARSSLRLDQGEPFSRPAGAQWNAVAGHSGGKDRRVRIRTAGAS